MTNYWIAGMWLLGLFMACGFVLPVVVAAATSEIDRWRFHGEQERQDFYHSQTFELKTPDEGGASMTDTYGG